MNTAISPPDLPALQKRCMNLGQQLGDLATLLMDEERVLDGSQERKWLLADFADFRAPLGLALGHLRGYLITGDDGLRQAFNAAYQKAAASLHRIQGKRGLLTTTQALILDRVEQQFPQLRDIIDRLMSAGPQNGGRQSGRMTLLSEESAAISSRLTGALTVMLDEERTLPATPQRKELLAQIADVRGPIGIASSHLRDYLVEGNPASRRLFGQFLQRAEQAMGRLQTLAPLLSASQQQAFTAVQSAWAAYPPAAQRGMLAWDTLAMPKTARSLASWAQPVLLLLSGLCALLSAGLIFTQQASAMGWLTGGQGLVWAGLLANWYWHWHKPLRQVSGRLQASGRGEPVGDIPIPSGPLGPLGWAALRTCQTLNDLSAIYHSTVSEHRQQVMDRRRAMMALSDQFAGDIHGAISALEGDVHVLFDQVQAIRGIASNIDREAAQVEGASQQAGANLRSISNAIQQSSQTAMEISRQVQRSMDINRTAAQSAGIANQAARDLDRATGQISDMAGLIEKIASEIQILSFNAAIEAARAGEAGLGFAVVATEVKGLALKTRQMTGNIHALVAAVHTHSNRTADAISQIDSVISNMNAITQVINDATARQEGSTRGIAIAATSTDTQVSAMLAALHVLRLGVNQAQGAAQMLDGLAHGLSDRATQLHEQSGQFVAGVRAA